MSDEIGSSHQDDEEVYIVSPPKLSSEPASSNRLTVDGPDHDQWVPILPRPQYPTTSSDKNSGSVTHTLNPMRHPNAPLQRFYGVRRGRDVKSCIFLSWEDCEDQVEGVDEAEYSTFYDIISAAEFAKKGSMRVGAIPPSNFFPLMPGQMPPFPCPIFPGPFLGTPPPVGPPNNSDGNGANTKEWGNDDLLKLIDVPNSKKRKKSEPADVKISNDTDPDKDDVEVGTDTIRSENLNKTYKEHKKLKNSFSRQRKRKPDTNKSAGPKENWMDCYKELKAYFEEHGTCEIGSDADTDPSLKELLKFVKEQKKKIRAISRSGKKPGPVFTQKIKMLRDIDFDFEIRPDVQWMKHYQKLKSDYDQNKICDIAFDSSNSSFNSFVTKNGEMYRAFLGKRKTENPEHIVRQKIDLLQGINFDFETANSSRSGKDWDEKFEKLQIYKEENGDCDIKKNHELHAWALSQRTQYKLLREGKKSALTAVGMQKLVELGFSFSNRPLRIPWEDRMEQLQRYKERHGHVWVPRSDKVLGTFAEKERKHYKLYLAGKKSPLSNKKLAELEAIGFIFRVGPEQPYRDPSTFKSWSERYQQLLDFKEATGHCVVPQALAHKSLAHWVHTQRKEYQKMKKGAPTALTVEKVLKLTEAGFAFSVRRKSVPS